MATAKERALNALGDLELRLDEIEKVAEAAGEANLAFAAVSDYLSDIEEIEE